MPLLKEMYVLWARVIRTQYFELKRLVQRKMVQWLRTVKQAKAADWFAKHHTGAINGNRTLADCGIGSTTHNIGLEGTIVAFEKQTVNSNAKQNS